MESIIVEKLKQLSPECHKEVIHFIDVLPNQKGCQSEKRSLN